jgi:hypothetical protein
MSAASVPRTVNPLQSSNRAGNCHDVAALGEKEAHQAHLFDRGLARMERAKPQIFLFSLVGCLSLQAGSSYSNRVPVALPQPEKSRFPSASKNWIVALYSKLLAPVRWTLAVTTPDPAKTPFSS